MVAVKCRLVVDESEEMRWGGMGGVGRLGRLYGRMFFPVCMVVSCHDALFSGISFLGRFYVAGCCWVEVGRSWRGGGC